MLSPYAYQLGGEGDHWRPGRVDGMADRSTIETLERLLGELANSVVV